MTFFKLDKPGIELHISAAIILLLCIRVPLEGPCLLSICTALKFMETLHIYPFLWVFVQPMKVPCCYIVVKTCTLSTHLVCRGSWLSLPPTVYIPAVSDSFSSTMSTAKLQLIFRRSPFLFCINSQCKN